MRRIDVYLYRIVAYVCEWLMGRVREYVHERIVGGDAVIGGCERLSRPRMDMCEEVPMQRWCTNVNIGLTG